MFCCCCMKQSNSDNDDYITPRNNNNNHANSTSSPGAASCHTNDPLNGSSPPLLANSSSPSATYTPGSPRVVRGRHSNSANEYVSHVVNLCQIGCGSFAVVSLVIDKKLLNSLRDSDSALPAFFAVKRISKRHEAQRLGPGEGGAHAERHTHAMLEHPFFPVLYNASRSSRDFYIAFPFALGADVSKALARRANKIRGFGKQQAAQLHAQATVGGTLQGMRDLIGTQRNNNNSIGNNNSNSYNNNSNGNGGVSSTTNSGPNSLGKTNTLMMMQNSAKMGKRARSGSENEEVATNKSNNNSSSSSTSPKSSPRSSSSLASLSHSSLSVIREVRATQYGLPISFVCVVAYELLSAIAFLNEKGYTHYDIRPGNLLLVNGGHVILGDFGMIRDESGFYNINNGDPMNSVNMDPNAMTNESKDHSAFSKFFHALMGKSNSNNESNAGPYSNNASFSGAYNNNASFGNNSSFYGHNKNHSSPNAKDTSNEKRSQLYLAPEHLSSATNTEAENDCKRLSDVWSYGVLLMELALGSHPFTPQNGQDSSAYAMLASIKKMVWRKIPTNTIESDLVADCVDMLNDLCSAIFVPRDKRPSAMELMQHPFFASTQVRSLVGIVPPPTAEKSNNNNTNTAADTTSPINTNSNNNNNNYSSLPNTQFFGKVVNAKKLVGPASLDPAKVCRSGGCPTAKELREWLSVLAPCPQHVAPEDFAPTLEMDVFDSDTTNSEDSRELIDLRFFGSLSEDDLANWNKDDNDNCLRSYDTEWVPSDMACGRSNVFSSHHASSLNGAGLMNENHKHEHGDGGGGDHNNNNNKKGHNRQRSGGGYYNYGGELDHQAVMQGGGPDQPGFTFVRPNTAMMNGQHAY